MLCKLVTNERAENGSQTCRHNSRTPLFPYTIYHTPSPSVSVSVSVSLAAAFSYTPGLSWFNEPGENRNVAM